jgi:C1A family cysteine protease
MQYVEQHAQDLESEYAYTARDGSCQASTHTGKVTVSAINTVEAGSVAALKAAIANGPTSVTVCALSPVFQQYTSGIVNDASCGTQMDHAITAVGYGTEAGVDYYIVRNSWGASWGDAGYIKIAAVEGVGICGIQQTSVWPTTN